MTFGLRLILISFAAFGAGAMFISDSFSEPLEGMDPPPLWKGILAVVLGIALLGFGIKCLVDDNREQAGSPGQSEDDV